jgi:glycosyltransferase involved in cell wall biosynthesis
VREVVSSGTKGAAEPDGAVSMRDAVVMVGPSHQAHGGISSVVAVYREHGLFERSRVSYLESYRDGGAMTKVLAFSGAWFRFLAQLAFHRVSLLHVHSASRASFWRKCLFLLPAFALGVPTVLHLHSGAFAAFYEEECGPRRKALIRWVFGRVDMVVVLSSSWLEWTHSVFPSARIRVIHNPVVVPSLNRQTLRTLPIVLSLGRLGRAKGTFDLLDAAAELAKRGVGIRLRLAGDGEVDALRCRASELGIAGQVDFLGWIGPEERRRELAAARVFTLPSYNEGMPMSILEAMAASVPVISTRVGGIPDTVRDGIDGFLVPVGDVAALGARLEELLTDPVRSHAMGCAAHDWVSATFNADTALNDIEALYREVLGSR